MDPRDKELERSPDGDVELTPADEAFVELLASRFGQTDHPGLCLSEETVELLERLNPPVAGDAKRSSELVNQLERTAQAMEFEATLKTRREEPSLGSYLSFLMNHEGLTAFDAAKEVDCEFQLLKELQNDQVAPQRIPARPFIALLQRLKASLQFTERLLMGLVRAPQYQVVSSRGSLYRGAPGATRSSSDATSLAARGGDVQRVPNPEYQTELEAATNLVQEIRAAWRTTDSD